MLFRSGEHGRPVANSQSLAIEEALAAIGVREREALVLHYFQDLAYPEIAAGLGIKEAAARKRVSRGLQRLEREMRRRGVKGSGAGLLTAIAAQQCAMSAPSGLASSAIAASTVISARWLTFTTLVSATPVKVMLWISAFAVLPLFIQWPANARLRAEVAELRDAHRPRRVVLEHQPPGATDQEAQLTAKRAARIAAENRVSELRTFRAKLNEEVVISFGSIETMARKLARVVSAMNQLEMKRGARSDDPATLKERQGKARELAAAIPEAMHIAREIPRLEREPAKAAHFYATLAGEILHVDEPTQTMMKEEIAAWVEGLQRDGLALIQRPRGKAMEWDARRNEATRDVVIRIQKKLPLQSDFAGPMLQLFQLNGGGNDGLYEFLTTEAVP